MRGRPDIVYREVALEAALSECAWHAGDHEAAFQALNRGFALTRGYGFTRGVFDDTPALTQIIAAAVESRKLRHLLPDRYFCKFGDVFREHPAPAAPRRKPTLPLEPLTDREIEILKLVARGLSNHGDRRPLAHRAVDRKVAPEERVREARRQHPDRRHCPRPGAAIARLSFCRSGFSLTLS